MRITSVTPQIRSDLLKRRVPSSDDADQAQKDLKETIEAIEQARREVEEAGPPQPEGEGKPPSP